MLIKITHMIVFEKDWAVYNLEILLIYSLVYILKRYYNKAQTVFFNHFRGIFDRSSSVPDKNKLKNLIRLFNKSHSDIFKDKLFIEISFFNSSYIYFLHLPSFMSYLRICIFLILQTE